jgi:uncharacterized Zn finger protein (UPF0148 family)
MAKKTKMTVTPAPATPARPIQAGAVDGKDFYTTKPASGPYRPCPTCGKFLHAKKTRCPNCDHMFPPKAEKETTRKTTQSRQPTNDPTAIARAVAALGGVTAVEAKLAQYTEIEDSLQTLGGIGAAQQAINMVRAVMEAAKTK